MNTAVTDPRLGIGANFPPSPLALVTERVNGLYDEAKGWLDGEEITNQATADGVAKLLDLTRKAEKDVKAAHEVEKAPHLAACREVDAAYKPIKDKAALAVSACKAALAPWLIKQEEEKRRAAEEVRRLADEALAAAAAAVRSADHANLAEIEAAETALADAKKLERKAGRAERDKAGAGGEIGRTVSLRTRYVARMSSASEALKHYRLTEPQALKDFLQGLADRDVRAGKHTIPGFSVEAERSAV